VSDGKGDSNGREYLEQTVSERARHTTAEAVRTTCSFARAERLLGREYHGRFLIELLQNAADAWGSDARSTSGRSRVRIVITDSPALLVANQGTPMTPAIVIDSLGHIGASTKHEGEAIGHKGIGFKSVLEISQTPQIYSGLQDDRPGLAVAFDPVRAQQRIGESSPDWEAFLASVQGIDLSDDLAAIPILRFPSWVDSLPADVEELAKNGFDTVVRLPFDQGPTHPRGLTSEDWLGTVRTAIAELTDQILVLLGFFSEVKIVDRLADTTQLITPEWMAPKPAARRAGQREHVRVLRDGKPSSDWRLARRSMASDSDLSGEVAVGLRLDSVDGRSKAVSAVPDSPSAPFHLFFPTRIASGLPLLLHGYFEVDAARTAFYGGSTPRNETILAELAGAVVDVVRDAANDPDFDLASLVNLIAACNEPEDKLARRFREEVLIRLDTEAWIPVAADDGGTKRARPAEVLITPPGDRLNRRIADVFPPGYVSEQVALKLPEGTLTDRALALIGSRPGAREEDFWRTLSALLRPGARDIWPQADADAGFLALLDLIDALTAIDRAKANALIANLQGDGDSRLLPAVRPDGGRHLLPVPNPSEGVAGNRSALVMARIGASGGDTNVPPKELDLAFLAEGLLASEADVGRARALGVRPFTVDTVLDRLNGIGDSEADPPGVVRFLWYLLARARVSALGTQRSAEIAAVFDPSQWFWCQPDRARDETGRGRQQRERYLSEVQLPAQDGTWRAAGSLAFGEDWAAWLESSQLAASRPSATRKRAEAYRALEAISPGKQDLLAPPEIVLALLDEDVLPRVADPAGGPDHDDDDRAMLDAEHHAFLLRLGVWEVVPIKAWSNWSQQDRMEFPWTGPIAERQKAWVAEVGGWTFGLEGWGGKAHHNVYLAEDYRFAWPLPKAAARNARALATSLHVGVKVYTPRLNGRVFCPRCSDSGSSHPRAPRESTAAWEFPSWLALELRNELWLDCLIDGVATDHRWAPVDAWWREQVPVGAGLRQSPWRLLPLSSPATAVTPELRRLIGINTIEEASLPVLGVLLRRLRDEYEAGTLAVRPGDSASTRQAFVGLHRLIYEQLAELSEEDPQGVADAVADLGVLCEIGDGLSFRAPADARHDDGRFATYARFFAASVPYVVLPRPQTAQARILGAPPFDVHLTREGGDDGQDVTDDLHELLGARIPELLAIVVNHSLGGQQTIELDGEAFAARSRRLQALTVRQVPDLVIHASVEGTEASASLGKDSFQDIYLENPTSTKPILFHDLNGAGWQDRLRRKIAPHLATLLENPGYAHTFALFLLAEADSEREEFLLELGITGDDVEAVEARLGVIGKRERDRNLAWYRSVLRILGVEDSLTNLDEAELLAALDRAHLPAGVAQALIDAGGGDTARRDTGTGSPLQILSDAGVDLAALDQELRNAGDGGLTVSVTKTKFARWVGEQGRRLAAVLATRRPADAAKSTVRGLHPPDSLAFSLDPPADALVEPIVAVLTEAGFRVSPAGFADDPSTTLTRLAGLGSVAELDAWVLQVFNAEEQRELRQTRGAQWRREIRLLAVLCRMGPTETRTSIRNIDRAVDDVLAREVSKPSDLIVSVEQLFTVHQGLRNQVIRQLEDTIQLPEPNPETLLAWAADAGVNTDQLSKLKVALDTPRRDRARAIKDRSEKLAKEGVTPIPPKLLAGTAGLSRPGGDKRETQKVTAFKVDPRSDRRKRELGDEGEQWALAAVIGRMLQLTDDERASAVDEVCAMLRKHFEGTPVEAALSHAALARSRELDEDELIEELTGLLHVSLHSDAFGFDLIGWLPTSDASTPQPLCLEVKSSGSASFHVSSTEWALAEKLHKEGTGDQYAVLVVRRGKQGQVPVNMDLLADPVALRESGRLRTHIDGWSVNYN
jgi:hypothetical protein